MKPIVILYIFGLFVLFNKNPYISLHIPHKYPLYSAFINSFMFSIVFYIVFQYIQPMMESMIVFNEPNVNNDLVKNVKKHESNDWVLIPPSIKETPIKPPPNFTELPIQCAADYGNNIACCGQLPAVVPFENTCKSETPYCNGYIANEKWGTCQVERPNIPKNPKLVSPPPEKPKVIPLNPVSEVKIEPQLFTCRAVSELKKGNEYTIIGRFGKYVIWNVHDKNSTLGEEKTKIKNAGYLLLPSNLIPKISDTDFDGYNIGGCIQNIVDNYSKNKMPNFENMTNSAIFFPGDNNYSYTYNGNYIVSTNSVNLFSFSHETELTGVNKFLVLIDPKI